MNQWWLKLFFYFLDVGTTNELVLYILSDNIESMNIANFKLRVIVGNNIKVVPGPPKEVLHQLVCICTIGTSIHLCDYCYLFYKKNITQYKWKSPKFNIPLFNVVCHGDPVTGESLFDLYPHVS